MTERGVTEADAMRLAIALAEHGEGDVNPNPLVGAVVLKDGEVIGRGYHKEFGGPHAEVFALRDAGDAARGATLVVTLEPCCCHGKTPPCTDAIVAAGISRVVVAQRDPSPQIAGKGIEILRAARIEVEEGLLREEASRQAEVFLAYVTQGRPFVQLKLASSLDGRIATRTGDAKWISGPASRVEAHRLRRRLSAILVGVGTVVADDPRLDVRHVIGKNPVPVVLDPSGRIPLDARVLSSSAKPIVVTAAMPADVEEFLRSRGVRVWRLSVDDSGRLDLTELLDRLGAEGGIDSVLVEGGGETAASFLDANVVDKVSILLAPILIGGRDAIPAIGGLGAARIADASRLHDVTIRQVGDDLLVTGYPHRRATLSS